MKKILAFAVLALLASGSAFAQVGNGDPSNPEDRDITISASANVIVPIGLSASGTNFSYGTIDRTTLTFTGPSGGSASVLSNIINLTVTGDANDPIMVTYTPTNMTYQGSNTATGQDVVIETSYAHTGATILSTGVSGGTGTTVLAIKGTGTITPTQQRGAYAGSVKVLVDYNP
jgi:hypothetical protein